MKRLIRDLSNETKQKIANALRGRSLSASHKEAISQSMKEYWAGVPYSAETENKMSNLLNNEESM